uniref:SH3 domain-containing protein n=1 Tax=Musca domestica TaxID=7370 RepID=A0A1I8MYT3_MUSDO
MLDKSSGYCSLDYDVPVTRPTKINKKLYAKALYDNDADSPDELAFRKGDILTVLEQDTEGLVGWWLCTLRGRQGLCPGNRLRIYNSYDSGCFSPSPSSSPCPSLAASTATLNSSICSADIYENISIISGSGSSGISSNSTGSSGSGGGVGAGNGISASQTQLNTSTPSSSAINLQQRHGTRRSWHVSPNKVITPQRHGDVYIYNIPQQQLHHQQQHQHQQHLSQSHSHIQQQQHHQQQIYQNLPGRSLSHEFETYDIPKPAVPVNYDTPVNIKRNMAQLYPATMKACSTPIQEENYDVPRPLNSLHQHTLTPSSSNSSLLTSESLSLSFSSSNRSSLANMPDYDVPRSNPLPVRAVLRQQQQQQQHQHIQQQSKRRRAMTINKNKTAGSDSDDNSDNISQRSAHTPRHSLQQQSQTQQSSSSSSGSKPCPYNFLVQLDPSLSSDQCIAILLKQIQDLRKTYNIIKTDLASIDRRRKKLRRREREKKQLMQNQQQMKVGT